MKSRALRRSRVRLLPSADPPPLNMTCRWSRKPAVARGGSDLGEARRVVEAAHHLHEKRLTPTVAFGLAIERRLP
jgi:hypothetical protein